MLDMAYKIVPCEKNSVFLLNSRITPDRMYVYIKRKRKNNLKKKSLGRSKLTLLSYNHLSFRDCCVPVDSHQRNLVLELFVQIIDFHFVVRMKNKQMLGLVILRL